MTTRATTARRPSHASKSLTHSAHPVHAPLSATAADRVLDPLRASGLWTSLFGAHRRKPGGARQRAAIAVSSTARPTCGWNHLNRGDCLPRTYVPHYRRFDPSLTSVDSTTGVITGGTGDGFVTLRSAVIAANAHAGADSIMLSPASTNSKLRQ